MDKVLTTKPTWWPITLQEAKDHLRILHSDEDTLIMEFIKAATKYCEEYTWQEVNQKSYTYYSDTWLAKMVIESTPIISVDSVKYYDENDDIQTLPTTDYRVNLVANWPFIYIDEMSNTFDKPNAIEIVCTVGVADVCDINNIFKIAILMVVANMYENRQDSNVLNISMNNVPLTSKRLLDMVSRRKFV